ncbi:MAG: endopeptidase La [Deltaproteobacteria bacterium]|nr:endopeptidase La [Deltaproteobacteria bacterium]
MTSSNPENTLMMPLLPLRDVVVFPHMIIPLFVGRAKSIAALEVAMKTGKGIFLASQHSAKQDDPGINDIYRQGTIGSIIQLLRLPDGTIKGLIEGKSRGVIESFVETGDFFTVSISKVDDVYVADSKRLEAAFRSVKEEFDAYIKFVKKVPPETLSSLHFIDDSGKFADVVASHLDIRIEDKQSLLEMTNVTERLERIYEIVVSEMEILQLKERINKRVKKQMEKTQKDYFLNEQMRAIQKEMGTKDDTKSEIEVLEKKMSKVNLSEEARNKVKGELKKLQLMAPMSAEATVVRTYVDWILDMPWGRKTENENSIKTSEMILEEDHYGLEKVKERILEYLSVQSLVQKNKAPILCLVGPPGVGKTSIAKSLARATNRKFVRFSLGGMRDEAEIRGHRRTYIGAMPGRIVQLLKKAGTDNPVMCLDEIDKLSSDFRGDPASALLEVLDPEQNSSFNDNYLEVDYDLSNIMFVTTANMLQGIPAPLQDRMEIIRIAGYTELEKLAIAEKFLVRKEVEANGLQEEDIFFTSGGILSIIREYTREAGVRNLEKEIASTCRKVAREIVANGKKKQRSHISAKNIQRYLGIPQYRHGEVEGKDAVGLSVGLAWTEFGGELLNIEATIMRGTGKTVMTGKLGDVMQESAQAALTYVRSRSETFGLAPEFYKDIDIHIHVPEGATPKDGPSAGIAIAVAVASALTKRKVRGNVAMTGEITLRGRVLPVGGLKEKLLAAHRNNLNMVMIPKDNLKDLPDIPKNVRANMQIKCVEHMDEVVDIAFVADSIIS